MKLFRDTVLIIALLAIGSVNAKGLKSEASTTTPSTQIQPPKTITSQPTQPKPVTQPIQPAQQSTAYNDILNTIKKTEASANDYPAINEIMEEIKNKYRQSSQQLHEKLVTVTLPLNNEMRTLIENSWVYLFDHQRHQLLRGLEQHNASEYNKLIKEQTSLGQKIRDFLEQEIF